MFAMAEMRAEVGIGLGVVTKARTSNRGQIPPYVHEHVAFDLCLRHGVGETPQNSRFDLNQGFADTPFRRDGLLIYESVGDPEHNDLTSSSPTVQMLRDFAVGSETSYRTPAYEGLFPEGASDPNSAPMQLMNLAQEEQAALTVVFPKAKVEGNCITTGHYVVDVKRLLSELKVSENGIKEVRYRKAYACLLRRLSREMGPYTLDSDSKLDPGDYAGRLLELLDDMEETSKRLERDGVLLKRFEETWGPDVCVYVRRAAENYAQCLLAVTDALKTC